MRRLVGRYRTSCQQYSGKDGEEAHVQTSDQVLQCPAVGFVKPQPVHAV
jgi:hypothetical protein